MYRLGKEALWVVWGCAGWDGFVKMTENELGKVLREMYDNVPEGYQSAYIHLFGAKYADCPQRHQACYICNTEMI